MAPAGVRPRGPTPLLPKGPETTAALLRGQAVMIRTRPSDRASSYGTYGQGMDKCKALAHPLPTLAALAPTSSPLQQQRFFAKATSPAPEPSRIVPSSQAIRRRNSPVKYREVPTEQSDEQQWCLPRSRPRRLRHAPISGLHHAACTPSVYASKPGSPPDNATLDSGRWPTLTGRDSHPLGRVEDFRRVFPFTSPSLLTKLCLAQREPGPEPLRSSAPEPHALRETAPSAVSPPCLPTPRSCGTTPHAGCH